MVIHSEVCLSRIGWVWQDVEKMVFDGATVIVEHAPTKPGHAALSQDVDRAYVVEGVFIGSDGTALGGSAVGWTMLAC